MRRRELDGCPIAGVLQMLGDKWTMLIIRDLVHGPKRTMELHTNLEPISSRTLVARLRDMEKDRLLDRKDFGGNPPHIEYTLTERGRLLLPLISALMEAGRSLECSNCENRKKCRGSYCEACTYNPQPLLDQPVAKHVPPRRRERDDSIVLL